MARRATALLVTALTLGCCLSASALAADPFGPLAAPAFQTSYSDEVLADSPVAYWRLGESSGTAMTDVTGANNGTYTGGFTLGQPGAFPFDSNTAVTFNGTTGRASAADSSSLDRTGAVTVELWVKRTKSAAYQVIVGKPGNGQSRFENYAIWFNTSNRAQAYFGNGSTFVSTVSAVVDTNWHHIAATYNNAVARIYVDGVQSGSANSTVALTPNQLPFNAARADANQYYFGGTLDEIAIYPTALSPARLQAHHAKAAADVTPPTITLTQPVNGSSTNDTTPGLAGIAGTAVGDSTSVTARVYEGAGTSGALLHSLTATRGVGGSYAIDSPALAEGTYTARAEQADTGGNTGFSGLATFTVDTSAPSTSITSGPADPTSSTSASLQFTSEAGAGFECKLDAGSYAACTSPKAYSGLGEGAHTFSVRASDTAGNTGPVALRTWTVDTTGPTTSITSGPADPTSSTSASLEFTSEAGATFECKLDAGSYSACTSPKAYSGLGEGAHTFSVRATDAATNTGPPATRTWTIDTTAPALTITSPPDGSTTNDTTPSLAGVAGNAIGDSTDITVRLYAGTTATGTPTQTLNATRGAGGVYAVDAAALTSGTYTARASQPDSAGNSGQSGTTTFTIDTAAPTVTLTSPVNGGSSSSSTPSFSGVASSASGDSANVTVRIYSGGTATGTPVQTLNATRGGGGAYAVSSAALAQGTYTARSEQTDTAGNSGLSSANTFSITISTPDPVLIGAGDIAGCGSSEGGAGTAALIQQNPTATVFTLGDNAYPSGQPAQYTNCYGSSWGAFKSRTRPITGGHDTETVSGGTLPNQGFANYFSAQLAPFGETATNRLKSYYSYDIGAWHVVMLNSACYYDLPGCNVAQQEQWFRDDLAANDEACTAVMWHDSRWSSGEIHGDQDFTQPFWQIAYEGGADIVLGGNEHHYERYAPQDANGAVDNQFGIRAFVVGTGGYYLYGPGAARPNSQVRSSTYGVMKLTLRPTSYNWQFLPVAGETFTDSGTGNCHGKPAPPPGTPTVRSSASSTANHPSTALTVAKPAGTVSGDVLVASIGYQTGSARNVAPPAGWTAVPNTHFFDGGNAGIRAFYRIAGASEPASYTFALTGGSGQAMGGGVMAIVGADPLAPINASGGQTSGGANVSLLTAPSITTTKPNTALIYSGAVNQPVTWAAPQLMPELWDVDTSGTYNIGASAAVGGVAAAGPTGTRAATLLPLARGVAISIAIAGP